MRISLRPVLAFFTAYSLNTILHEAGHAIMAWSLGLHGTLFQWYVNIDYQSGDRRARVLCAVAGPLFSLCLGAVFWLMYRRFQARWCGLLLLYSWILAMSFFLGNLFSTSFAGGDFGVAVALLSVPAGARLAATIAGGLSLADCSTRRGRNYQDGRLLKRSSCGP